MVGSTENKVEFGLKNVHYAIATDDGTKITYGEVQALPGATEISIDPEGDTSDFYADNTKYYTSVSNQGYSGKLTLARVPDAFAVAVLGEKKDETTGMQTDDTSSNPKQIALMFEFDGDKNATRHSLFYVTVTRPSIGSKTKEDKVEVNTTELSFTAAPDPYENRSHGKCAKGAVSYDKFFDEVVVPGVAA
jgi:phi13 family phage major tail protein